MARHRKTDIRMWGDEKFRALSRPPPNGQSLWQFLLTCPFTGSLPGLFKCGEAAMAEELDWPIEGFRKAFREVSDQGMAEADWKAKVIWVPNAIRYNVPESPNVVRGWRTQWDELPECDLKREAFRVLKAFVDALGEAFAKAFREAIAEPSPKPMPNQEQEQEQEQDLESSPAPPVARSSKPKPAPEPPHPRYREVTDAYFVAFESVHRSKPIFDGKDGKHVKTLLKRCNGDADRAIAVIRSAFGGDPFKAKNATIATIAADPSKYLGSATAERKPWQKPVQPMGAPTSRTFDEWQAEHGRPEDPSGAPL